MIKRDILLSVPWNYSKMIVGVIEGDGHHMNIIGGDRRCWRWMGLGGVVEVVVIEVIFDTSISTQF